MRFSQRAVLLAATTALLGAAPASAASPDVVISQVYGGGGNSGATYKRDFIELFNRGSQPVDVSGWSVQYASSAGSSWTRTDLSGSIAPGRYYLVQEAAGTGGTTDLPAPDASGNIAMAAGSGKVALVRTMTNLTCGTGCTANGLVHDFVGYGSANDFEGFSGPAPALSNTTADLRHGAGCTDTDDNAADFSTGDPAPRNSSAAPHDCAGPPADAPPSVTGSTPANNDVDVPLDVGAQVTFSEPVDVTADAFDITCASSGTHALTVTGGPTSYDLDPAGTFDRGESCTLAVRATEVSDQDTNDPPDHPSFDYRARFTTEGLELRIHEIQGTSHVSPVVGKAVSHVPGVVTAVSNNGFWMQDTQPDADPRTSEGVFVFRGGRPAIGSAVQVSGTVAEFRAAATNLTTTEIDNPRVVATGDTGTIEPTVIGAGGRIPPGATIDDDSTGDVDANPGPLDPEQDGIDFYESLEGMLVQVNDAVAVGPTNQFGETPVVGDDGRFAGQRSARGGVVATPGDFNPERIILDDVIAPMPRVNVGDHYPGAVRAVVDYGFGNFMLHPLSTPTTLSGGLQREVTDPTSDKQLSVASFNVENLDPGDPPEKVQALAQTLVTNLRSPDLVAVEEIQDDDGPQDTAVTDAATTWNELIAAIQAAGGPRYEYRQIDPVADQDGGEPGGNIRQGFLFRTDRGLEFVDRPGGTATNSTAEDGSQPGAQLTLSPGRIQPDDAAFANSRKPLAGEFRWRGRPLFVVANHFNSKGGDDPLFGRRQPPQFPSEDQRHAQAAIVNGFVKSLLDADKHAHVVVLGDLNDFDFSQTLRILAGDELTNLMDTLPPAERYSYVYEGNSEVLDQILVSKALLRGGPEYDSVHVNSEFADQTSDHDPQVARLRVLP
jgi:uncharacterized protein